MKNKETLEKAAENYNDDFQIKGGSKAPHIKNVHIMNHFIAGAKWQAERMYSEEEVITLLESLVEHPTKPGYKRKDILKVIEQFKKK